MLVTTTILERGVTFPSVDVVVLDAGTRFRRGSACTNCRKSRQKSKILQEKGSRFFPYGKLSDGTGGPSHYSNEQRGGFH
ncbi:hypothetical protein [Lentibacillus sp. CBA3610]|uniref:hypothetical protein n=1 Tax=Lentibacillus sp. CBA3610 TaxID=2518176 RepID=UPI00350E4070